MNQTKELSAPGVVRIQSDILVSAFLLLIIISIAVSFFRFFVLRDYAIESQIPCDPSEEACFVYHCDPAVEECMGDPEADTSYYKIIERHAAKIPLCDPNDETCPALICERGETECFIKLCEVNIPEEGQECSDPAEYQLQHPMVTEETSTDVTDQTQELSEILPDESAE